MYTSMLIRRLPWLMPLLVGCGDDAGGDGGTSSTTGGGTVGTTMSTVGTTMSTSAGEESSTSTTEVDPDTTADGGTETTGSPPVTEAVDDTYFAIQKEVFDVAGAIGILANDTDAGGGPPTLVVADMVSSAGGAVMVDADGGFSYTPPALFWGPDSFGYTIEDGSGEMSSAMVTVHVAPARIQLDEVTAGMGGFVLDGEASQGASGFSVSGAGDVNGDGLDDLLVGAPFAEINGFGASGRSYVVFGKADTAAVQLSAVAMGTGGFVLDGEAADDMSGRSVSGAGDVNGDGLDDLVVGAYRAPNGTLVGRSYVVFGKADTAAVQLSAVAVGMGGFVLDGEAAGDHSGFSVSGAGDVNGDGMDDLVVGAHLADPNEVSQSGRSYVVFGKADTAPVQPSDIAMGVGGFVLDGETSQGASGFSVSGAGDVNGDGLDDLLVGAPFAELNGFVTSGRSYVVFGKADTAAVQLSAVAMGVGGFVLNGGTVNDRSGSSVSGAGDVNGDGLDDLVVGAYNASPNGVPQSGRSYVVFGKVDTAAVQMSNIAAGQGGFVLDGELVGDSSGFSVSGAGDFNGDDLGDLLIGAFRADPNGSDSGRSYVVFGEVDTAAVQPSDIAAGLGGFVLDGEVANDYSGMSVSGAGDVNGDGMADLVIGAYRASPNGLTGAGRSYVVFGVITTNTCCNPHTSPGCVDAVIEQCVCATDPACCDSGWDPVCVEGAINNCSSVCTG